METMSEKPKGLVEADPNSMENIAAHENIAVDGEGERIRIHESRIESRAKGQAESNPQYDARIAAGEATSYDELDQKAIDQARARIAELTTGIETDPEIDAVANKRTKTLVSTKMGVKAVEMPKPKFQKPRLIDRLLGFFK